MIENFFQTNIVQIGDFRRQCWRWIWSLAFGYRVWRCSTIFTSMLTLTIRFRFTWVRFALEFKWNLRMEMRRKKYKWRMNLWKHRFNLTKLVKTIICVECTICPYAKERNKKLQNLPKVQSMLFMYSWKITWLVKNALFVHLLLIFLIPKRNMVDKWNACGRDDVNSNYFWCKFYVNYYVANFMCLISQFYSKFLHWTMTCNSKNDLHALACLDIHTYASHKITNRLNDFEISPVLSRLHIFEQ